MSKFNQGGKPSRPVIVTSAKRRKLDRRMANEIGVQRAKAVKAAVARAEDAVQSVWVMGEPYQEGRVWRCDLNLMAGERNKGRWFCMHNHKSPQTARACAERELKRRNKDGDWTEEKVMDLVREVTAKG